MVAAAVGACTPVGTRLAVLGALLVCGQSSPIFSVAVLGDKQPSFRVPIERWRKSELWGKVRGAKAPNRHTRECRRRKVRARRVSQRCLQPVVEFQTGLLLNSKPGLSAKTDMKSLVRTACLDHAAVISGLFCASDLPQQGHTHENQAPS